MIKVKIYELNGTLFFGSVINFRELFTPDDVIIEFKKSRVSDHLAIEVIDNLTDRYIKAGKRLHLRHLSEECKQLLDKEGIWLRLIAWKIQVIMLRMISSLKPLKYL